MGRAGRLGSLCWRDRSHYLIFSWYNNTLKSQMLPGLWDGLRWVDPPLSSTAEGRDSSKAEIYCSYYQSQTIWGFGAWFVQMKVLEQPRLSGGRLHSSQAVFVSGECRLQPLPAPVNGAVFGTGLRARELTGIVRNCLSPEVKAGIPQQWYLWFWGWLVQVGIERENHIPLRVVYFNLRAVTQITMEIQSCQDTLDRGRAFTRDDGRTESALFCCLRRVDPLTAAVHKPKDESAATRNV